MTVYQQQRQISDVAAKANASGAALFVSIHCNAATNKAARGTETWRYTGCPHGAKYAAAIQHHVVEAIGTKDRGVKTTRSLYVLRKTTMPAVLVEVGFISNAAEEKEIISKTDQIGQAIAAGIIEAK